MRVPRGGTGHRATDDAGGVWIVTGLVVGAVVYAGMVAMLVAGFTAVTPLVVVPPVLAGLIAANNLLGGGRSHGRSPGRPIGESRAPLSSSGTNGPIPTGPAPSAAAAEEPSGPR